MQKFIWLSNKLLYIYLRHCEHWMLTLHLKNRYYFFMLLFLLSS